MYRHIALFVLALSSFVSASVNAAPIDSQPDLAVSADIKRIDREYAEVTITGKIADGLHIYAQTQPKPFLATKIMVADSSGGIQSVGDFQADRQPTEIRHEQLHVEIYQYEGTVQWRANVKLSDPNGPVKIEGTVFAQACQDDRCFAPQTYAFSTELAALPASASQILPSQRLPTETAAKLAGENTEATATQAAAAFSVSTLQVKANAQPRSAWTVLPLSFVAGFLLNFMPCVLPVVGLKLLSFVQQSNSDRKRIFLMNIAYTAGLLSVMLVLATLAVFAGFGWGEQFSSAGFTVTLSAIVFAFGLSFLGVWEIPLPGFVGAASGQTKQEGYGGAFSKGILSTLLATPCSGPFLGAALAWAVTQPAYLTYSVFATVGLGMASPYLVVGLFPSTIRFLPKPGNWMVAFKQAMGFVMLATVVYLISFMPVASVVPTVLLLLGIAAAVWFAAQTPAYETVPRQIKAWSIATAMILVTSVVSFGWLQGVMQTRFERAAARLLEKQSVAALTLVSTQQREVGHIAWETYSQERLESLAREGKPVFVDFTADWCLTCKANEASAIETDAVAEAIRSTGAVALRADKTEPNAEADELLRKLGNSAASIPFYAVFPADDPSKPILLDGVFASSRPFVEALNNAQSKEQILKSGN